MNKRSFPLTLPILISVCWLSSATAQDSLRKNPNTALEKAQIKVGAIIKKEFLDLYSDKRKGLGGSITNWSVQILNITDASSGEQFSGLYFEKPDEYSTRTGFIDGDEIPGLLKFVDYLEKTQTEHPQNYTEYTFNSNDIQVYAYYALEAYSKKRLGWNYGIKIDKYFSNSSLSVDLKTLTDLRDNIAKSKDKFIKPW